MIARPLYKKLVRPLAVFLVDSEDKLLSINSMTENKPYHRMFILSNKILRNLIEFKSTDSISIFNFNLQDINTIIKLSVSYSNPMYDHLIVFLNDEIDFDTEIKNFINSNYFQNSDVIGFTRSSFVFENLNFTYENKINLDPLEHFKFMDDALNGIPVDKTYFKLALEDLLPQAEYIFETDLHLEQDLIQIIKRKNIKGKTKFKITNKEKEDEKNVLIFSSSEITKFKFVVKRTDNLNCYIL